MSRSQSVPALVFPAWLLNREEFGPDGGSRSSVPGVATGHVYERSPLGTLDRDMGKILFEHGCTSLALRCPPQPFANLQDRVLRESEGCQKLVKACDRNVWIALLLYSHYAVTSSGKLPPGAYAREMLSDEEIYERTFDSIVQYLNKNRSTFSQLYQVVHDAVERVVCKYSIVHSV